MFWYKSRGRGTFEEKEKLQVKQQNVECIQREVASSVEGWTEAKRDEVWKCQNLAATLQFHWYASYRNQVKGMRRFKNEWMNGIEKAGSKWRLPPES